MIHHCTLRPNTLLERLKSLMNGPSESSPEWKCSLTGPEYLVFNFSLPINPLRHAELCSNGGISIPAKILSLLVCQSERTVLRFRTTCKNTWNFNEFQKSRRGRQHILNTMGGKNKVVASLQVNHGSSVAVLLKS